LWISEKKVSGLYYIIYIVIKKAKGRYVC